MNVPTVEPSVSTPKTSSTATAIAASSTQPRRIDDFIKSKLQLANSDAGSGILDTAKRASALGFASSANSRYAAYLEAFRSAPAQAANYAEAYPNCVFLPWAALHLVMKSLDLWCDLPEFYAGAVPSEQLPWMEIFELDPEDNLNPLDGWGMANDNQTFGEFIVGVGVLHERGFIGLRDDRRVDFQIREGFLESRGFANTLRGYWEQAFSSFFVVAPKEAFTTTEDWFARFRKVTQAVTRRTEAPNDPLVIRFCNGGALVVAAWGDEAAALNEITKELGI